MMELTNNGSASSTFAMRAFGNPSVCTGANENDDDDDEEEDYDDEDDLEINVDKDDANDEDAEALNAELLDAGLVSD